MEVIIDGVIYVPKEQPQQTWVDPETNLEWHWEMKKLPWKDARKYAESLGDGWRLPTIHELLTLVDYSLTGNVTKNNVPIKNVASRYWTSTLPPPAGYSDHAWYVYFYGGGVNFNDKSNSYYVRCVRGEKK
jgi:hypothetical protein